MPGLGQRCRYVARVNHAGVFGPRAVVGQIHPGVADAGQVLQLEYHGLGIGLGGHGGQGEGGGGHGVSSSVKKLRDIIVSCFVAPARHGTTH